MPFPQLHKLNGIVGNNHTNDESDVAATKLNFARLGYYNEPIYNGIIDAGLIRAINQFQEHEKLKRDGWMMPAGETEHMLHKHINNYRLFSLKIPDIPVTYDAGLKKYDFSMQGAGHWGEFAENPWKAKRADDFATDTKHKMFELYGRNGSHEDNEADAFRHALWSYKIAKKYGVEYAKQVTDAHERERLGNAESLFMDLENNRVGASLSRDAENFKRKDEDVIRQALKERKLRLKPYKVKYRQ